MIKKCMCLCLSLLLILSFLGACQKDTNDNVIKDSVTSSSSAQCLGEGEKSFIFTVVTADGTQTVFNISTNKKTVGEALKEHKLIDGEEGQFGLYVKTVNSVSYDYDKDGKYWAFYVNGEYASTGVDKTEIKKGESYMFRAE